MDSASAFRARREAAIVAVGLAALYLLTLTANHTEAEDALGYAAGIREGGAAFVLHPHHVGWGSLGWLAYNVVRGLGSDGGPLPVLQVQNVLVGAAGVGVLWWWLRSIGWQRVACTSACGVLAFSYGYWFYSGEAEVYVLSAALLVCCIAAAHSAAVRPSRRRFALLGLANGLAVIAHDTNALFAAVALAALALSRHGAPRAEVARRAGAYVAVAAALVVPVYIGAALANGRDSPGKAYTWISGYANSGTWGNLRASSGPKAIVGGSRALVGGHFAFSFDAPADALERQGGRNPREERFLMRDFPVALAVVLTLVAVIVAALVAAAAVSAWRSRRALSPEMRALAVLCACWALVYAAFFTWWEPINVEFWIATWIPLAVLLSLFLTTPPRTGDRRRLRVLALVGSLALVNLVGSILPSHSTADDYWRVRTKWYERHTTRTDLVVSNNYVQSNYLVYFTHARILDGERLYQKYAGKREKIAVALRTALRMWPGGRLASGEVFDPAADRWSTCNGGDQCARAVVLRRTLVPGARVIHRGALETVWELARPH